MQINNNPFITFSGMIMCHCPTNGEAGSPLYSTCNFQIRGWKWRSAKKWMAKNGKFLYFLPIFATSCHYHIVHLKNQRYFLPLSPFLQIRGQKLAWQKVANFGTFATSYHFVPLLHCPFLKIRGTFCNCHFVHSWKNRDWYRQGSNTWPAPNENPWG